MLLPQKGEFPKQLNGGKGTKNENNMLQPLKLAGETIERRLRNRALARMG